MRRSTLARHVEQTLRDGRLVRVIIGDLTQHAADAIVNAANSRLAHGGGVAGALSRAAGPALDEASRAWLKAHGEVMSGHVAVTPAGDLPARWVIHAVGPIYQGGGHGESATLASAVSQALRAAHKLGCETLAMPAISSGLFGYPLDEAASVIVHAIEQAGAFSPQRIDIVVTDDDGARAFAAALEAL